jgi:hypothetical protein
MGMNGLLMLILIIIFSENILLSENSINRNSINPVHSKFNINSLPVEKEKPITNSLDYVKKGGHEIPH